MNETPKIWHFSGAALDQLARSLVSPSGLRGLPRALAVRAGLDAVPDGLDDLAATIGVKGLHVVATVPDTIGEAMRAVRDCGLVVRVGRFELRAFAGGVADPGGR